MIAKQSSDKIKIISLLATWAVVAWHCACGSSVEKWFIPYVLSWSVPWFFCVSGFFFIKTAQEYSIGHFYQRKIRTLLLPYLYWCLIGWCIYMPGLNGYGGEIVGLSSSMFPLGNIPLWYIRALMVFSFVGIIFVKVLLKITTSRVNLYVAFTGLMGLLCLGLSFCGVGLCAISSVLFFLLGVAISLFEVHWTSCKISNTVAVLGGMVALVASLSIRFLGGGNNIFDSISTAFLILGVWLVSSIIKFPDVVMSMTGMSAGIYFMHDPIIRAADKLIIFKSSHENLFVNCYYFTRCVVFFSLFSLTCFLLKRCLPRFSKLVFGGR